MPVRVGTRPLGGDLGVRAIGRGPSQGIATVPRLTLPGSQGTVVANDRVNEPHRLPEKD